MRTIRLSLFLCLAIAQAGPCQDRLLVAASKWHRDDDTGADGLAVGYLSPMVSRDQRYFEVQLPTRRRAAGEAVIR